MDTFSIFADSLDLPTTPSSGLGDPTEPPKVISDLFYDHQPSTPPRNIPEPIIALGDAPMNGPASIIALDEIPRLLNNAPPAYAPLPPPQPIFVEEPAPKKARHNEVKDFSALTFRELEAIHRFLHDPAAPATFRFRGTVDLQITTSSHLNRKVFLPGALGSVAVHANDTDKSAACARARAGGCLSWWNTCGVPKNYPQERPKFVSAFTCTMESLSPTGPVTMVNLGRWPPTKGAPRAPVDDSAGGGEGESESGSDAATAATTVTTMATTTTPKMTIKDAACMATIQPGDAYFAASALKGTIYADAVENAKSGASKCSTSVGGCGAKIEKGALRLRVSQGRYPSWLHVCCVTAKHVPSVEWLVGSSGEDGVRASGAVAGKVAGFQSLEQSEQQLIIGHVETLFGDRGSSSSCSGGGNTSDTESGDEQKTASAAEPPAETHVASFY